MTVFSIFVPGVIAHHSASPDRDVVVFPFHPRRRGSVANRWIDMSHELSVGLDPTPIATPVADSRLLGVCGQSIPCLRENRSVRISANLSPSFSASAPLGVEASATWSGVFPCAHLLCIRL